MLIDDKLLLSEDVTPPTNTNATDTENILDFGFGYDEFGNAKAPDYGKGTPLFLHFQVTNAITSSGNLTVAFKLQDSADGSNFADVITLFTGVAKADLVQGYQKKIALPENLRRYVKGVITCGTAGADGGQYSAWICGE